MYRGVTLAVIEAIKDELPVSEGVMAGYLRCYNRGVKRVVFD